MSGRPVRTSFCRKKDGAFSWLTKIPFPVIAVATVGFLSSTHNANDFCNFMFIHVTCLKFYYEHLKFENFYNAYSFMCDLSLFSCNPFKFISSYDTKVALDLCSRSSFLDLSRLYIVFYTPVGVYPISI